MIVLLYTQQLLGRWQKGRLGGKYKWGDTQSKQRVRLKWTRYTHSRQGRKERENICWIFEYLDQLTKEYSPHQAWTHFILSLLLTLIHVHYRVFSQSVINSPLSLTPYSFFPPLRAHFVVALGHTTSANINLIIAWPDSLKNCCPEMSPLAPFASYPIHNSNSHCRFLNRSTKAARAHLKFESPRATRDKSQAKTESNK